MAAKPLTWQQVLIVFCVLGLLPAAVFSWGPNIPNYARLPGMLAFFLLLAAIVALSISHVRRVNRSDLQPDILAQLFNPASVFQVGPMHFVIVGRQIGRYLQLTVVVQNLKDGEGQFLLKFEPEIQRTLWVGKTSGIFEAPLRPFDCTLHPASLVLANLRIPVAPLERKTEIRLWMRCSASATGTTVRFARRRAVTKRTSGWVTLLALFGGHVVTGGGTFLKINFVPTVGTDPEAQREGETSDDWQALTLWTLDHPATVPEMVSHIREALAAQPITG
jgi:hypothetical protein